MYEYNAIITNVVDGDTYDVDIDLGFHIHIHERIRVLDLDTPEKRGAEKELGMICYKYAKKYFEGRQAIIRSKEEIKSPDTDSFGRWLCRVWVKKELKDITNTFTALGCNKLSANYSEKNVEKLADLIY